MLTFTAGDDYIPVNEILIFVPGRESVECFNVSINDDNIFETSESFTLSLGVEHDNVPENATVYILDDECKILITAFISIACKFHSYLQK